MNSLLCLFCGRAVKSWFCAAEPHVQKAETISLWYTSIFPATVPFHAKFCWKNWYIREILSLEWLCNRIQIDSPGKFMENSHFDYDGVIWGHGHLMEWRIIELFDQRKSVYTNLFLYRSESSVHVWPLYNFMKIYQKITQKIERFSNDLGFSWRIHFIIEG